MMLQLFVSAVVCRLQIEAELRCDAGLHHPHDHVVVLGLDLTVGTVSSPV